jgi:hypothetical protein
MHVSLGHRPPVRAWVLRRHAMRLHHERRHVDRNRSVLLSCVGIATRTAGVASVLHLVGVCDRMRSVETRLRGDLSRGLVVRTNFPLGGIMKRRGHADVKLRLRADGKGEVVVNGIHFGHITRGTYVFSEAGEATIVRLDILADQVEVEAEDVQTVINWLKPEPETHTSVREHQMIDPSTSGARKRRFCSVCRIVEGTLNFPSTCPGPPEWLKKQS